MTQSLESITVGCVGLGNMGSAIVRGLSKTMPEGNILGFDSNRVKTKQLTAESGMKPVSSLKEMTEKCDYIILAVKPDLVTGVTAELKNIIQPNTVIISIAAGISNAIIQSSLNKKHKILRCMPNTPSLVGEGMLVLSPNAEMDEASIDMTVAMFSVLGKVIVLPESMMDAVTGVSGSGPAYVFTMIHAMADGAVRMGIPRAEAVTLAAQTVYGAAKMVLETGDDPIVLRGKVTSPGGTTIEGVFELEDAGFSGTVMRAIEAATVKSRQLGGR
jgi:pyrroline-5-carboxylate reductase